MSAACGGPDVPLLPSATPGTGATTPGAPGSDSAALPFGLDVEALALQAQLAVGTRQMIARGFQCGWHSGWMRTVKDARNDQPSTFRKSALGSAFTFGVVMLVAGVTATMFLAWLLLRLARRRKKKADAPDSAQRPPGWSSYFKEMGLRFLHRVGRFLHVELFDPVLANQRAQSIYVARDIERQLAVALECVNQLTPAPPASPQPALAQPAAASSATPTAATPDALGSAADTPAAASAPTPTPTPDAPIPSAIDDVKAALVAWRMEVQSLRAKLETAGALPRELSADLVLPRLEDVRRASRDLRVGLERQVVARGRDGETPWTPWLKRIGERPKTPREQTLAAGALPTWVKPLGLGGLGALALSIPMMAAWMAAGAFPLFFSFLVALGGLGAVLVARVSLHRAGRLPLLPGFADRVASWLTTVCALAFAAMVLSSWMSSESGLDLGDPPPVPVPDPVALQAPDLWNGTTSTTGSAKP
ncbi:MAG: hypothetical protein U1F43_27435 [Myxococcota bacterium]